MNGRPALLLLAFSSILAMVAAPVVAAPMVNDYPTEARVDYVFGCMAVNGRDRDTLRKCSCSLDIIASILPYDRYVEAETILSLRKTSGERMEIFRSAGAQDMVDELRRAQAEAEISCF